MNSLNSRPPFAYSTANPEYNQYPENVGEGDQDQMTLKPTEESAQQPHIELTNVENFRENSTITREVIQPLEEDGSMSERGQFHNTVNVNSHQRLLEIEEKRKKRKIRKTQQHFRGSSFGQGSNIKSTADIVKAYEFGSKGFALEESNDFSTNDMFMAPNIESLKNRINNVLSDNSFKSLQNKDISDINGSYDELLDCITKVSNEDLLDYVLDLEKEKTKFENIKHKMDIEYKQLKSQHDKAKSEFDQVKASYKELISKFGEKEIQTRGYRLALNNSNELLYEVIHQIENSVSTNSIPVHSFINSMNMKIMKLLENSTKELQNLTDINPQSCLNEILNENKDPIEDAFSHLRSLLKFQTALKRSANFSVSSEMSQKIVEPLEEISEEYNNGGAATSRQTSKSSGGSLNFSEFSTSPHRQNDSLHSTRYIFQKMPMKQNSYSKMHSMRSSSREQKKKKTNPKIYSQLLTTKNSQYKGIFIC